MIQLFNGDCLEIMDKLIADGVKVDAVITDPPYGTTACKWDNVIPFDKMWERLKLLRKENSPIVLFGSEPFSSYLRISNIKEYKYDWVWNKKIPSGMSYARYRPMQQTENISVFCRGRTCYIPQMIKRDKPIRGGGMSKGETTSNQKLIALHKVYNYKNPTNILTFDKVRLGALHPTQKPLALMEYLIKTYTNEEDTVLDFCAGSMTTGVACQNLNRNCILIEKDEKYFEIGKKRLYENKVLLTSQQETRIIKKVK